MSENPSKPQTPLWWTLITLRVFLGCVFLYAGLVKVFDPDALVQTVANYRIPPFDQAPIDMWVGYFLPIIEIIMGLGMLLGVFQRGVYSLSALVSLSFLVATISVWVRGLDIDCGCFGDQLVFEGYLVHTILLVVMLLSSLVLYATCFKSQKRIET